MSCTGPCVVKYVVLVGQVLNTIWNSGLKDIILNLSTKPDMGMKAKQRPTPNQQMIK